VCVEACPIGAIALVDGKTRVDEELRTGCGACVDARPLAKTAGADVTVADTRLLWQHRTPRSVAIVRGRCGH